MFEGNYSLTLDAKGRLSVPRKYRHSLEGQCGLRVVITIDPYEGCLVVYPISEWRQVQEELGRHRGLKPGAQEDERVWAKWMQRLVIGNAYHCDMDSHGRLLVPPDLRKRAGLDNKDGDNKDQKRQVRVVGLIGKFELWSEAAWSRRSEEHLEENKEFVDRVMKGSRAMKGSAEPEPAPAAA